MFRRTNVFAALVPVFLAAASGAAAQTNFFDTIGQLSDGTAYDARRKALGECGVSYLLIYTNDVLGNPSGGIRRIAVYQGKLEASVTLDLDKLVGWRGLSAYVNLFQLHNTTGMRDENFNANVTISNIEAIPATRFQEYWIEQKLLADRFSIRFGQLAADSEFFISSYSLPLVSSDWPPITTMNLPSGGPAYPLSSPGIRFRYDPNANWSALFAVFNGDPGQQGTINRTGTNFPVKDPPLIMGEIQYRYNQEKDSPALAGILRLGGWHYFGKFDDQRFDTLGISLANPLSNGVPRQLRGTSGIYGIVDQQLYRPKGGSADSGVGFFSRVSASPSNRSVIDFYLDSGIIFSGLNPARPNDKVSIGFIYAKYADRVGTLDVDRILFSGVARPIRDYELIFELNYLYLVRPGWAIQPLIQYLVHPGGNVPNPNNPTQAIRSGAILGVRSTLNF
jgi:porin